MPLCSMCWNNILFCSVLVCSGFYERIPQIWWLINNRNLFLIVLEAGKAKIKVLADFVSSHNLLPSSQMDVILLCPHMVEGVRKVFGGLFCKGINLLWRLHPHDLITSQRCGTIMLGVRFKHKFGREYKHSIHTCFLSLKKIIYLF